MGRDVPKAMPSSENSGTKIDDRSQNRKAPRQVEREDVVWTYFNGALMFMRTYGERT